MRRLLLAGVIVAFLLIASPAFAHQSGCHGAYSCPSDHHTYTWYSSTGLGWSCAASYAPEYDPMLDTHLESDYSAGMTWWCRAAGTTYLPPVSTDTDFDGVPDTTDNCPNQFGSIVYAGCPAPVYVPAPTPAPTPSPTPAPAVPEDPSLPSVEESCAGLRSVLAKDKRLLTKAKRLAHRAPTRSNKRLVSRIRRMIADVRGDLDTYCS